MRMPGFTAEASLDIPHHRSSRTGAFRAFDTGRLTTRVVPAQVLDPLALPGACRFVPERIWIPAPCPPGVWAFSCGGHYAYTGRWVLSCPSPPIPLH